MSLTVGLTGGIASGKSLVAGLFTQRGVAVIDADQVARDIVVPGSEALSLITQRFGPDILEAGGTLNRRRLREWVFSDPDARRDLELIMHPRIKAELARRRDAATGEYRILMVPLLARSGMRDLVDRILVVDTSEANQLQRLVQRDNISQKLAQSMLGAQETREQRLKLAHDVLVNDGAADPLDSSVDQLHRHYLAIARGQTDPDQCLYLPRAPLR